MENEKNTTTVDAAIREAANRRAAQEAALTYAARQRYNFLLVEQQRERYRQTQRLAELKKNYERVVDEPGLTWETSATFRHAAWKYATQLRLLTDLHRRQERERDRFLDRAAALRAEPGKPSPSPDDNASFQRPPLKTPPPETDGNREPRAQIGRNSAPGAAFPEAANRRAALEARLSEEQYAPYQALRQKQEADLKRQEKRLEQRRQDYESEQRKQGIAPKLEMIPMDRHTPRALRDAAREYAAQDHWVADLKKAQEHELDRFLERAVAGEPEREGHRAETDTPRPRQLPE